MADLNFDFSTTDPNAPVEAPPTQQAAPMNFTYGDSAAPANTQLNFDYQSQPAPEKPTILDAISKLNEQAKGSKVIEVAKKVTDVAETPIKAALDVLDRFNFSTVRFFDTVNDVAMNEYSKTGNLVDAIGSSVAAVPSGLYNATSELISPKSRMRFADLIKKTDPEAYNNHPIASEVTGGLLDIGLNPLNLFSLGASGASRLIGEGTEEAVMLAPKGMQFLKGLIKGTSEFAANPMETKSAEQFMLKMLNKADAAVEKGISTAGWVDKGGLKILDKTVIPVDVPGRILKYMGLDKIPQWLNKLPGVEEASGKIVPEVKRIAEELQPRLSNIDKNIKGEMDNFWPVKRRLVLGQLGSLKNDVHDLVFNVAKRYKKEDYKVVGDTMQQLHELTNNTIRDLMANGATENDALETVSVWLKDGFDPQILGSNPQFQNKMRNIINNLRNQGNASSLFTEANGLYQKAQTVKFAAGIVKHLADGYFGDAWNFIKNPAEAIERYQVSNTLRANQRIIDPMRRFDSYDYLRALGYSPEHDLLQVLSLNLLNAGKQATIRLAQQSLVDHFGSITQVPKQIAKDFQLMGATNYLPEMREWMQYLYKGVSWSNRFFTRAATQWLPRFSQKQIAQNTLQNLLVNGVKGSRMWDMETHGLMAVLNSLESHVLPKDSEIAQKLLSTTLENGIGERATLGELYDRMRKWSVLKGTDISGTQRISEQLVKTIEKDAILSAKYGKDGENALALRKLLGTIVRYPMHASFVEDHYRGALFMNLWKQGKSDFQAAQKVDSTFFDYANSFTRFENTWLRHFATLFYSYPRFAIPMVAKVLATHPNRVANLKVAAEDFVRIWAKGMDGRQLTEPEQNILAPWKMGQPSTYDEEKKQFHTQIFNNFNPLDIQDLIETNPDGSMDVAKSVQKVALGHVSKAILMPLEEVINRDLFTDKVIRTDAAKGQRATFQIGKVDANQLLENVVGAFMAHLPPGKAMGYLGVLFPKVAAMASDAAGVHDEKQVVTDYFKKILDWSELPDVDGNPNVYVRPHAAWLATQIVPQLSQAIRMARYDNPMSKSLDFFFGIPTYDTSATKSTVSGVYQIKKEIESVKSQMKYAAKHGQDSEEIRYKNMLDTLSALMKEKYNQDQVRQLLAGEKK